MKFLSLKVGLFVLFSVVALVSSLSTPSSALVLAPTATYTDRIQNSHYINELASFSLKNTKLKLSLPQEKVDQIQNVVDYELPLSYKNAKEKIDNFMMKCKADHLSTDNCFKNVDRVRESSDMLTAVVNNIQKEFEASQLALATGMELCNETEENLALCFLGTSASVGGGILALIELVAPHVLPGTLGGPAGLLYAVMTLGGAWLSGEKCKDPLVAYLQTIKVMAEVGVTVGIILSSYDISYLMNIVQHLDSSNINVLATILQTYM